MYLTSIWQNHKNCLNLLFNNILINVNISIQTIELSLFQSFKLGKLVKYVNH